MIVLSHRGYWKAAAEKNRPVAFARSFDLGFGTETDIRDFNRDLIVSHDMPSGDEPTLAGLLEIMAGRSMWLALNIKSDGLGALLLQRMRAAGHTNWFTFDMSVPDLMVQIGLGLPVFTRASEFERQPPCYQQASGVWLDAFESEWYNLSDITAFLDDGKYVCLVSPELHGRDPGPLWTELKASPLKHHPKLMICTDRPEEATIHLRENL